MSGQRFGLKGIPTYPSHSLAAGHSSIPTYPQTHEPPLPTTSVVTAMARRDRLGVGCRAVVHLPHRHPPHFRVTHHPPPTRLALKRSVSRECTPLHPLFVARGWREGWHAHMESPPSDISQITLSVNTFITIHTCCAALHLRSQPRSRPRKRISTGLVLRFVVKTPIRSFILIIPWGEQHARDANAALRETRTAVANSVPWLPMRSHSSHRSCVRNVRARPQCRH